MKTDLGEVVEMVRELFKAGRRTVSTREIEDRFKKEYSRTWQRWLTDNLNSVAEAVEHSGMPCVLVSARCVRRYSETPVTDQREALFCTTLGSGGQPPAGIRRSLADDLVTVAHHDRLATLSIGGIRSTVVKSATAERDAILPQGSTARLARKAHEGVFDACLNARPEATQGALPIEMPGRDDRARH